MIAKFILLFLVYTLIRAYDSDKRLTYNQKYIISNSDDTLVCASKSLVGFWLKNINFVCIHNKSDFLNGITSSAN